MVQSNLPCSLCLLQERSPAPSGTISQIDSAKKCLATACRRLGYRFSIASRTAINPFSFFPMARPFPGRVRIAFELLRRFKLYLPESPPSALLWPETGSSVSILGSGSQPSGGPGLA